MDQNMDNPNSTNENQPQQTESQASPPPTTEVSGDISKDAKMWGMFCHLAALVAYIGIPFGHVLGPLIIWLIKKDDFAFVQDQGKEALNFQISMTIYALVSSALICIGIGVFLLIAVGIVNLIFIIIASIAANKGEAYRYPLCIRLIK